MLRNLFALTEQGAKDLKKGIIASIFSSLSLMLPMGLMLMLVMQLLQPLSGIEANEPSLKLYVVLCIALLMIIFLTHYIQYRCTYIAAYKESAQRRIGLAEKLRMLPLSFFGKRDISDLTTTMMSDCSDLEKVFAYTIPQIFGTAISCVMVCLCLFFIDWRMALAVFSPFILAILVLIGSKQLQDRMDLKKMQSKLHFFILFLFYDIIISNRMIRKLSRCMEKEFYEEYEDMEAGIDQKQALVEESKKVDEIEDFSEAVRFVNDLKKRWRKTGFGESLAEEKLREEFDANIEKVYEKQKALAQKVVDVKEALIKEAEKTSLSDDFKKATEKMTSLMDQWKVSGNAGKKTDDELWERFNAARQKFYDRKHANWENRAVQFENAKKVKEDLIEKAKSLQDSEEWQKTSAKYKELMDAWKAAGNAGREFDDDLWNAFNEARQNFYAKRNEFYEKLHAEHDEKYAEKQALVKEAKSIAGLQEYTREQTAMMKELSNKWKSIGFCGKDKEDEIWNEFRGVMDEYFAGLKSASEKRRANWRDHMAEIISRKEEQIANQKRQIKRLQDDMTGLVSEATVADLQDQVEDKEDFIKQLEQEIEDIEKKLAE
mgnify:CR=1 FL=1